ncbi:oxidoreductase family protein [Sessilibacter corallicola]|uniref:oxidoreductase family protein n=1 Tax=Sessilibacter corallicola TaxID=2904075 RepID=UPI001E4E0A4B|nr:oxidoreductase family protein [Sessilibacter corallicola]MCE2030187.1 DUF1679 domain-containing protein [Sessilibacter corallicola]
MNNVANLNTLKRTIASIFNTQEISFNCIQPLWSNYGSLYRCHLSDASVKSVIVKHVQLPKNDNSSSGLNRSLSHMRKLRSYEVELYWYQHYCSSPIQNLGKLPEHFYSEYSNDEFILVIEDLVDTGFTQLGSSTPSSQPPLLEAEDSNFVSLANIHAGLSWLAHMHAAFLHTKQPTGLWPNGSYWHLETRPSELNAITDSRIKHAAPAIAQQLRNTRFSTLIHGDAKVANFCFNAQGNKAAAVDFQYVGGGCGIQDVMLFLSSCLNSEDCFRLESELLDYYFSELKLHCQNTTKNSDATELNKLEEDWRSRYCFAWADFVRFLSGWNSKHWKLHAYALAQTELALKQLK